MKILEVYVDGSSKPNPGKGTCAYVILDGKTILHEETFSSEDSTNNIMELTAVIKALKYVEEHYAEHRVYLYTDSQYVQLGITSWLPGWKKRGWRTSAKKEVSNKQLWIELDKLYSKLTVHFQWVRGHSGNKWNVYVDNLCEIKHSENGKEKSSEEDTSIYGGQESKTD